MKRCTYCGKEYPDGAVVCVVDEQPLESVEPHRAESETGPSKLKRGGVLRWIQMVAFCALVAGGMLAFYDYVEQFSLLRPYRRERAQRAVDRDTRSALLRRFAIGAGCVALLGIYFVARDIKRKQ